MTTTTEENSSLWWLTVSPAIWGAHFILSYATASIWCGKVVGPGGSLWEVRLAIAIYSVVALAGIGITGWIGYRRHSYGGVGGPTGSKRAAAGGIPKRSGVSGCERKPDRVQPSSKQWARRHNDTALPHDADTPEDRYRFLGFATLLLSALSGVATVYAALVLFFFRSCP